VNLVVGEEASSMDINSGACGIDPCADDAVSLRLFRSVEFIAGKCANPSTRVEKPRGPDYLRLAMTGCARDLGIAGRHAISFADEE